MTARTAPVLKARPPSPEGHDLAYRALCLALAGRLDLVDWPAFSLADCDRLIATARAEGVAPLLYHALEGGEWKREKGKREKGKGEGDSIFHPFDQALRQAQEGPQDRPPSSVLHELRAAYYSTAAYNLLLYHELARILQAIDNWQPVLSHAEGLTIDNSQLAVPTVVLKGAALATAP